MSSSNGLQTFSHDLHSVHLQALSISNNYENASRNNASRLPAAVDTQAIVAALSTAATDADDPVLVRVSQTGDLGTSVEWCAETELNLDLTHTFHRMHVTTDPVAVANLHVLCDDIIINTNLLHLLSLYNIWHKRDLAAIASVHNIRLLARDTAATLMNYLYEHECNSNCSHSIAVFTTLRAPRSLQSTNRPRALPRPNVPVSPTSFMALADDSLKHLIIKDWQNAINTNTLRLAPCAVCARRIPSHSLSEVDPADVDLSLLRNDALPPRVLPTTYAFELYDRAILYPPGLTDPWAVAPMYMCPTCRADVVDSGIMPKLCLANWLYYGIDELPTNVSNALASSTHVDRLLICRARTSRISFRFKQTFPSDPPDPLDPSTSDSLPPVAQRYVRGNVLVMPQNSTHLNRVLPPPPSVIRDTICAVFVGRTKPTRETIKKLRPLLARKSTVETLITFLVHHNPYYAADGTTFHGLDRANLNSLFTSEDAEADGALPCSMEIGFLPDNDSIRASTSDYTHRNTSEDEPPLEPENLLMENVGYTCGDESPFAYRDMKMRALSHCLDSGQFLCSRAGDHFVPDFNNPSLLTWLFPHLDPWGIGGFHHPHRTRTITIEDQLKYLLQLDDNRFEQDPDFAFVYYNILQKKLVCDSVRFRVKESQQRRIVTSLLQVNRDLLSQLISRYQADPSYSPDTQEERAIVSLINSVSTVLPNIPGTTGYKLSLQNEIRSLVTFIGTPAFFVTLNPSDIHHPLVRLFAGQSISLEDAAVGEHLSSWERKLLAAANPAACAKFFHTIISHFITLVLRYGTHERGLFGECNAYYGTVEAQARGTLHCHMLVWVKDHPSPQTMRDRARDSSEYTTQLFTWLEALIKSELLGSTTVVAEPAGKPLPRPPFTETTTNIHPGAKPQPQITDLSPHAFQQQYTTFVNELVQRYNWHEHTDTCWKYLKHNQRKTDENCRMRIDGTTRPITSLEPETLSIQLRRLHPRIANYNDLIIFLIQANMDIKHIGSGEAAKALIYYVTDYITKSSIPAHLGLAALMYAINASTTRHATTPISDWDSSQHRSALTSAVNSLLSRMEISHPQVMSYLIGGGDHYTSHRYRLLHYTTFAHHICAYWGELPNDVTIQPISPTFPQHTETLEPGTNPPPLADTPNTAQTDTLTASASYADSDMPSSTVTLSLHHGSISALNQKQDYLLRPQVEPFDTMSLYQYVGLTEKVTCTHDAQRTQRCPSRSPTDRNPPGRRREQRGSFLPAHPDHLTHLVRKRIVWIVPVVLGPHIPRNDRSDEEREEWARIILLMFLPWRSPADLKTQSETWYTSYNRQRHLIPEQHHTIIRNMTVLNDCREARDASRFRNSQHASLAPPEPSSTQALPQTLVDPTTSDDDDDFPDPTHTNPLDPDDSLQSVPATSRLLNTIDNLISLPARAAIDRCFHHNPSQTTTRPPGAATEVTNAEILALEKQHAQMRALKRKRRPTIPDTPANSTSPSNSHTSHLPASLTTATLPQSLQPTDDNRDTPILIGSNPSHEDFQDVIDTVILEFGLQDNSEQLRAFEIIARHVCFGGNQLLMYIGGVGGTGKSYLVRAVIQLFSHLGRRRQILLSAPTGAAAVLIGGYTIHSLLLLPNRRENPNLQSLAHIWDNVLYLIIDEVSMISAILLFEISSRLQHAKGELAIAEDKPFGGVHVIFLGDFGQLRPVNGATLYTSKFFRAPTAQDSHRKSTLDAIKGIYIWRNLVSTVVILRKNQRQKDDAPYCALLDRIRRGQASNARHNKVAYDFRTLQSRLLQNLDPSSATRFCNAPVIVGRKHIRDALNDHLLHIHARRIGADVVTYYAVDKCHHEELQGSDRTAVLDLPSNKTHDSLGRLPLFPGMQVMVQENIAFLHNVVNGAIGTVRNIKYRAHDNQRFVSVVYVHIPGAGRLTGQEDDDLIPIFPTPHYFQWTKRPAVGTSPEDILNITRLQPPILPAYAYTDYKSQGRSLDNAIVDLDSTLSMQGAYVMLSRVKTLDGVALLRPFKPSKIENHISEELRAELRRLDELDQLTATNHHYGLLHYN